jgi:hypothetical protein
MGEYMKSNLKFKLYKKQRTLFVSSVATSVRLIKSEIISKEVTTFVCSKRKTYSKIMIVSAFK